jgi:hypothetical protein
VPPGVPSIPLFGIEDSDFEPIATYKKVIKVKIVVSTACGANYFKIRKSSEKEIRDGKSSEESWQGSMKIL